MRYKVGQRVTIKPLEELKKCNCSNSDYYKFAGLKGIIQRIDNDDYTIHMDDKTLNNSYNDFEGNHWSDNGWFWKDHMLIINLNRRID